MRNEQVMHMSEDGERGKSVRCQGMSEKMIKLRECKSVCETRLTECTYQDESGRRIGMTDGAKLRSWCVGMDEGKAIREKWDDK